MSVQDGGASLQRRRDSLFERHIFFLSVVVKASRGKRLDGSRRDSHKTANVRGIKECKESANQQAKGTRNQQHPGCTAAVISFSLVVGRACNEQTKQNNFAVIMWKQGKKQETCRMEGVLKTRIQNKFRFFPHSYNTPGTCLCFKTLLRLASQPPDFSSRLRCGLPLRDPPAGEADPSREKMVTLEYSVRVVDETSGRGGTLEGARRYVRKGELHELLITSCSSSISHRFSITAFLMVPACQTVQMPGTTQSAGGGRSLGG